MAIGIFYREELKEYDFGLGHPFSGDRYGLFIKFLKDNVPEDNNYRIIRAEPASNEDLLLICQQDYIDFTREYYKAAHGGLSYDGNFLRFHSADNLPIGQPGKIEEAARIIIGQAKKACDLIHEGAFKKLVCLGGGLHHAKPSYGEGFCIYNDVAFCAFYLMREYKLERILILDTDAHAGNGTAEYFYEDPRVLLIDIHQNPNTLYPGTGFAHQIGSRAGKRFTVNIPLPIRADYDCYQNVFESVVEPIIQEFQPQVIIRNGGSDPHFNDELTNLGLSLEAFRMIGSRVSELSKVCDGKVIDLIASGYNMEVLTHAWLALITGLAGIEYKIAEPQNVKQHSAKDYVFAKTKEVIEEVKSHLKDYWKCLR
jgi:acetoin utilization protein AcuC